jgi:hypothetical protein
MKIKNYKLFLESLQDDFNDTVKKMSSDISSKSNDFLKALTNDIDKKEFMYRVSDGEDVIDLIEEFTDNGKLSKQDQFTFRTMLMGDKLDRIKDKYNENDVNAGIDLIEVVINNGVDKILSNLTKQMETRSEITPDRLIKLVQVSINMLQENEDVIDWAYQRKSNLNNKKIEAGKILIEKLRELNDE